MGEAQKLCVIVEDEWLLRMEIADGLMALGWDVVEANTGEQAIALLEEGSYGLLVTDIRLPGRVTGWDVAEKFRARYPDILVIYCSANPLIAERRVVNSIFFSKPVKMELVMAACGQPK
ncbi:MAG TPA: response regulator [Rhizomicrobium sp.]|nr:response regulator [Rhizomicrobium sp.]